MKSNINLKDYQALLKLIEDEPLIKEIIEIIRKQNLNLKYKKKQEILLCKECKREIKEKEANFCPYCGAKILHLKKCIKCNKQIDIEEARYCPFCGFCLDLDNLTIINNDTNNKEIKENYAISNRSNLLDSPTLYRNSINNIENTINDDDLII